VNEQERAEYRAFVRDHHPDRGGDPDAFVAGLARFKEQADSRYDAPIEIVRPLPAPLRLAIALIRTVRRQRDRRVQ
jgi:hypothetical protein